MKITRERVDGSPVEKPRKPPRHRRTSHNLPSWLMQPAERQAIAQRRTLMILSVLSGQKSVQEAIEEAQVSRALYYQMEDRGLQGMLKALSPRVEGVMDEQRALNQALEEVCRLRERVKSLTQRKRSAERLLRLLIKSNQARVTTERRGRPRKALSTPMMPGGDLP